MCIICEAKDNYLIPLEKLTCCPLVTYIPDSLVNLTSLNCGPYRIFKSTRNKTKSV